MSQDRSMRRRLFWLFLRDTLRAWARGAITVKPIQNELSCLRSERSSVPCYAFYTCLLVIVMTSFRGGLNRHHQSSCSRHGPQLQNEASATGRWKDTSGFDNDNLRRIRHVRRLRHNSIPGQLFQRRLFWFGYAARHPEGELIRDPLMPAPPRSWRSILYW